MTNQSLRESFGLSQGSGKSISQIIISTIEQELVKSDPNQLDSRRYARYIPTWGIAVISSQIGFGYRITIKALICILFLFSSQTRASAS